MTTALDLNQIVLALADALDLVGIDETAHGKRVGYMAFVCAGHLGMEKSACERMFNIGLLHDVGVSSSQEHFHLVTEMQWEGAQDHALEGAGLLANFAPLADFADVVRYHHTPWQELDSLDTLPIQTRLDANLVFLVDRIDALAASHYGIDLLEQVDAIGEKVRALAGTLFAPSLVETFQQTSASDAFWMMLEPPHLDRFMYDMQRRSAPQVLDHDQVRRLAAIFAHVVDTKSPFTLCHSKGVASLARQLAALAGLGADSQNKIEIAGLLHDIGKLRIPDEILEKPGPLSDNERRVMRRHSFETYQVLRRIDGLADVALWASYHHETMDGHGYPFRRSGVDLGIEARILAVADIFQALAQRRPYRDPLPRGEILAYLQQLQNAGKLDSRIVSLVAANLDSCYRVATELPR